MKTYEEMSKIASSLQDYQEVEDDDYGVSEVIVTIGDKKIVTGCCVEPEDAIWHRDLGNIYADGEELGMRSMYEAFKKGS